MQYEWMVVPVPAVVDGLVEGVAKEFDAIVGDYQRILFGNGNMLVKADRPPPGVRRVLLVMDGIAGPNGNIVELGLVADALRRWGPLEIYCLLRYLPYSRSNRVSSPGVALGAKVFIDLLCALPIDRFLTFDLHAPELVGFFGKPVHQLGTLTGITEQLIDDGLTYDLIVGTDRGRADECTVLADNFRADIEFFTKRRVGHTGESHTRLEDKTRVRGARVLLYDDEIDSGHSAAEAIRMLDRSGAASIDFLSLYDIGRPGALEGLAGTGALRTLMLTNATARPSAPVLPTRTFDLSPLLAPFR
ncbi:MAG: ribose-phosphate pyrophosphokinae [Nocardia sp.]|uniref:ribose-phosphate diphosphokinase n=1 Tax=Nocardia sp. TaxID=1821 RepID=UPI0026197E01|nr:ribose-phosphate diphosphokinase [Nocardia sp.]MCU1640733.1 ribose-phosphate pyrophosphokinae [Nocardia sp.]